MEFRKRSNIKKFKNRQEAGQRLAHALSSYEGKDVIVLGLPRGGVVLAAEIARALKAPLDLIFAHKIGHPEREEYAIGAVSESGHLITSPHLKIDPRWLEQKKHSILAEIKRRRAFYLKGKALPTFTDKTVIIVDDGIATGLTMQAAIQEVKNAHPKKLIVAIPLAPETTARLIRSQVDALIVIQEDPDYLFLGAVSAYYEEFKQVEDEEVIRLLEKSFK